MELYIHIPFCAKKCAYCDFLSAPAGRTAQRRYVDALCQEIAARGAALRNRTWAAAARGMAGAGSDQDTADVSSIFIGGGTPSLLPGAWIGEILAAARAAFPVRADAEISIEANPGTVTAEKLAAYRAAGVNRISFGAQSAQTEELRRLARIHTWADVEQSVQLARAAGLTNINLDLMSGLPGQSPASWERTLRAAIRLQPTHISAYSLIVEEGTPFWARYHEQAEAIASGNEARLATARRAAGQAATEGTQLPAGAGSDAAGAKAAIGQAVAEGTQLPAGAGSDDTAGAKAPARRGGAGGGMCGRDAWLPSEDEERHMYARTGELLAAAGYAQYEISNYARPGCACRHNVGYWTGVPYLGLGLGASSYMPAALFCAPAGGAGGEKPSGGQAQADGAGAGRHADMPAAGSGLYVRWKNTCDLASYQAGDFAPRERQFLGRADQMAEYMMLGLRLTDGVSAAAFARRFGQTPAEVYGPVLDKYERLHLLSGTGDRVRLTRAGISVSNVILADFLL